MREKNRERKEGGTRPTGASIIFQLLSRASTVWDSGIPGVIGLGFAAANVTGEIRRLPEKTRR